MSGFQQAALQALGQGLGQWAGLRASPAHGCAEVTQTFGRAAQCVQYVFLSAGNCVRLQLTPGSYSFRRLGSVPGLTVLAAGGDTTLPLQAARFGCWAGDGQCREAAGRGAAGQPIVIFAFLEMDGRKHHSTTTVQTCSVHCRMDGRNASQQCRRAVNTAGAEWVYIPVLPGWLLLVQSLTGGLQLHTEQLNRIARQMCR